MGDSKELHEYDLLLALLCRLETHDHLFFECKYAREVWAKVCNRAGWDCAPYIWGEVTDWMASFANSKSVANVSSKLCFAASVYHLWKERNARYHGCRGKSPRVLYNNIIEDVRYRLVGLKYKRNNRVVGSLSRWGISGSMVFDDGG
jgi:hypothetical protein